MVDSLPHRLTNCKHIFVGGTLHLWGLVYTTTKVQRISLYTTDKDEDVKRDIEIKLEDMQVDGENLNYSETTSTCSLDCA